MHTAHMCTHHSHIYVATCICVCVYVSMHMHMSVCIARISFYTWGLIIFVYLCIHYFPPCILGEVPLTKRKAENKIPGAQKEKKSYVPEVESPVTSSPLWEQNLLLTQKVIGSAPKLPFESPIFFTSETRCCRVRQSLLENRKTQKRPMWGKRQFAGMPKGESNSKQNILLINKKLSLSNATRSPLTPLDLKVCFCQFLVQREPGLFLLLLHRPLREPELTCGTFISSASWLKLLAYSLV